MAQRRGTMWRLALLYAALAIALAYPLSTRPGTSVMSRGPDTDLFVWMLAWDTHAFTHQPLSMFDANIYYPQRHTLAYSENIIGSALLAAPVIWVTGNPALAMNLVALGSAVLCALGAWLLARRVGISAAGAVICGVVFGFSPPRFLRIEQLHLATVQWIPFCLAFVHAYLDEGRPADAWCAAAFFTLEALSTGHGAVFLIVAIAALVAYRLVRGERFDIVARLRGVGVPGALLLVPTVLVFLPYLTVQRETGLRRTLENWTVTPQSYLASPSRLHVWMLSFFPHAQINEKADAYLFPGYLPIILTIVAVIALARGPVRRADESTKRDAVGYYVVLTVLCLWLSVGPPVSIWPFVYWLPGFNLIRVPSRFVILGVLGLAVLSGCGFDRLTARLSRVRAAAIAGLVVVMLTAEFAAIPFDLESYRVDIPAIDRWLATQPAPFVIAEVPMANPADLGSWERRQTLFMLHATAHWQKTVHGYSGYRPPLHERLYQELRNFPDAASLKTLSEIGVTDVVVHTDLYPAGEWPRVESEIARLRSLVLRHVEGDGRVYKLQR